MKTLTLTDLQNAVAGGVAAFRANIRLQPAGGEGTKVFPPTYSGGVYATERRRINGIELNSVLLNSVQAEANQLEACLREAWDGGVLKLPIVYSNFSGVEFEGASEHVLASVRELDRLTTLDAPHRIADAIFRDSNTKDGTGFREAYARAFEANIKNATALFELCPTALLFGTWDSTGSRGGLGNKFARALVCEVVGIGATTGVRTSSRLDPLAISSKVPIYARTGGGWTALESEAEHNEDGELKKFESKNGKGNPSAVNHSNVTPDIVTAERSSEPISGGVTVDFALRSAVLSLPALRRLKFPVDGQSSAESNRAAQTVLAALGLFAITRQFEQGTFLRSRCDLVPESTILTIERVRSATVADDDKLTLTSEQALAIYDDAVTAAKATGLPWQEQPIELTPSEDLIGLVVESRRFEFQELRVGEA
ncbi:type I-G CRISPR-associated RAMP protein Csb1/Cas7g [Allorhodopirellula solitaria]|uniref:CRISPR-associated protein n=1 Tax=Allorhodopirellula solitaria TaxID=2527987 RepID=A0A5C5YIX6_9BACT|nr:type I-U CRISPR-associated RAMP protein Csb1/Cas7u [Allorhodopirellula solitaria]TWT74824.1 CRISPR-associated protein [Allorhodopirellula solitaria]